MKKYLVYQHFGGSVAREIEADNPEEAEEKMLSIDDITVEEMMDCVWDLPEVQNEVEQSPDWKDI